jgi:hypothetical protein
MNYIGKTIIVQNASTTFAADVWATCGLPENAEDVDLVARDAADGLHPVFFDGNELLVRCPLAAAEKKVLTLEAAVNADVPADTRTASRGVRRQVGLSSWVTDELSNLIPTFTCEWEGSTIVAPPIQFVGSPRINGARIRYEFKTRFQTGVPLFVHGWFDIFDNQELVEFKVLLSWGKTTDTEYAADNSAGKLGRVWMSTGEEIFTDHRINKGIAPPAVFAGAWRAELANTDSWEVQAGLWQKGSGVRVTGALRCLPPLGEISGATLTDPRFLNTRHREEASVQCMLSKADWHSHFGPFGIVPTIEDSTAQEQLTAFYAMATSRLLTPGSENPVVPMFASNFPGSGTAGAQADFGAAGAVFAVGYDEPGALHWYGRDLDGWIRRPYIYHEDDNTPMQFKLHDPNCRTYNHMPHPYWGSDVLGWDFGGGVYGWYPHWSPFDEQHQSANLLMSMFALTRDPSLVPTILGMLQMTMLHFDQDRVLALGSSLGDPRGWGRPMIVAAWAYSVGFHREGKACMDYLVEKANHRAAVRDPALAAKQLKPLSHTQGAYGYVWPPVSGTQIEGISPWQESIGVMGLYAIWKLGVMSAAIQSDIEELIIAASSTVRDHCIYEFQGVLHNSWVYAWNPADPGEPWDPALLWPQYVDTSGDLIVNQYVQTYDGGMDWMIPAVQIAQEFGATVKGQRILDEMGLSNSPSKAMWWAVTDRGN